MNDYEYFPEENRTELWRQRNRIIDAAIATLASIVQEHPRDAYGTMAEIAAADTIRHLVRVRDEIDTVIHAKETHGKEKQPWQEKR